MDAPAPQAAREETLPERILRYAALGGGLALFGIMALVSISVFFRYLLGQPILGSQEIVEQGMAVVVMLAMPYTAMTGQHIRVDIFDRHLGAAGRFICDLVSRVIGIVVLALLIRKAADKALDAHEYEDVTNMLEIPVWIAYGAISIGMSFFVLVLALQLWLQFKRGMSGYE
ncbi:MAG: TRAP transporter small permease [Pseudomonadota bacterium]